MGIGRGVALMVGVGMVIATLGRKRMPPARSAVGEPYTALIAYLHEHLTGADAAIHVVERLRRTQGDADEGQLFASLHAEFENDRETVRVILGTLGASTQSPKRLLGQASGSVLKLLAGGSRGELSLFRTLEALAIGVQGKRCMWRALQSLPSNVSMSAGRSPSELEAAAVRQWEVIEERRRRLVPSTFASVSMSPMDAPRSDTGH